MPCYDPRSGWDNSNKTIILCKIARHYFKSDSPTIPVDFLAELEVWWTFHNQWHLDCKETFNSSAYVLSLWKTGPNKTDYFLFQPYFKAYPNHDLTFYYAMAGRKVENPEGHLFISIPDEFIIR